MGWENRNGRRYYYRKVRVGRGVASKYVGDGGRLGIGTLLADDDELGRQQRDLRRLLERGERETAAAEEREFRDWFGRVETAYAGVMLAAGFHCHSRGQWRKRRMGANELATVVASAIPSRAELPALIKQARAGDRKAAELVRHAYADDPDGFVQLGHGDVGALAERFALHAWFSAEDQKADQLKHLAMTTKLELLKRDLAGAKPSPIETLLAERAAICWLRVNELEVILSSPSLTEKQRGPITRRLDSAHRRYLSALKALATVRKLALPSIMVNLAETQTIVGQQNNADQQIVGDAHRH